MLTRAQQYSGGLFLFIATFVANVLGYGYQVVMARLLRPEEFAVLTALFGILILESISSQVIQAATAKLAAQYRAHDDEAALHAFIRRWSLRIGAGAAGVGLVVALLSGVISNALALPALSVALLGLTMFQALLSPSAWVCCRVWRASCGWVPLSSRRQVPASRSV